MDADKQFIVSDILSMVLQHMNSELPRLTMTKMMAFTWVLIFTGKASSAKLFCNVMLIDGLFLIKKSLRFHDKINAFVTKISCFLRPYSGRI